MKRLKLSALALLSIGFFACGGSETISDETKDELTDALEEIEAEVPAGWHTNSTNSYFHIDIPGNMTPMDLNEDATLQYGSYEESGDVVLESYFIVLMETLEEIESYETDNEFTALSYSALAVESLRDGLDSYEVLTKSPKVEKVNGLDCVKSEMRGAVGDVNVYYKLGVFEGEKAFYQVLTWTIEDQKPQFEETLDKIIDSFKEK